MYGGARGVGGANMNGDPRLFDVVYVDSVNVVDVVDITHPGRPVDRRQLIGQHTLQVLEHLPHSSQALFNHQIIYVW